MIDIRLIREKPDWVKAEIAKLYLEAPIDEIVDLDQQRRQALIEADELKAKRNRVSKSMGPLRGRIKKAPPEKKAALEAEFEATRQQMGEVNAQIKALDEQLREIDAQLEAAMLRVPNLPDPSVPLGADDSENIVLRGEGT